MGHRCKNIGYPESGLDFTFRQFTKQKKIDLPKKPATIGSKIPGALLTKRLRLSELEKFNFKINRAYLLKEAYRQYPDQWFWRPAHSRFKPLENRPATLL